MDALERLPFADLTDRLIAIAQRARRLAADGDTISLAELLGQVRSAADQTEGPQAGLLEVAEAFLRALVRSDLGRTEIALRRFVLDDPDTAERVLGQLADDRPLRRDELAQLGERAKQLIDVGVLRALSDDRWDLRPSLRSLARDLIEPAPFRLWRRVNEARAHAGLGKLDVPQTVAFLATNLGVTPCEAGRHLRANPLSQVAEARQHHPSLGMPAASIKERIVYRRERVTAEEHGSGTEDSQQVASLVGVRLPDRGASDPAKQPHRLEALEHTAGRQPAA